MTCYFFCWTAHHRWCFRTCSLNRVVKSFWLCGREMITVAVVFQRLFCQGLFSGFFWNRCRLSLNRHRSLFLRVEDLFYTLINQVPVLLQIKFLVVTDGWSDWLSTLNFWSYISELWYVRMLQDIFHLNSFLWIEFEHFHYQINCFHWCVWFEPFFYRTGSCRIDRFYHCLSTFCFQGIDIFLWGVTCKVQNFFKLI